MCPEIITTKVDGRLMIKTELLPGEDPEDIALYGRVSTASDYVVALANPNKAADLLTGFGMSTDQANAIVTALTNGDEGVGVRFETQYEDPTKKPKGGRRKWVNFRPL